MSTEGSQAEFDFAAFDVKIADVAEYQLASPICNVPGSSAYPK
jgi:hypothetical protein